MAKKRKSSNQLQKDREADRERMQAFNKQKAEEQQCKDMMLRDEALNKLGIQGAFGFEDHKEIYSFSGDRAPINEAPITMVDATVPPPPIISYPEYPRPEYSEPPAFRIASDAAPKQMANCNAAASQSAARVRRAKAIFQMNVNS